MKKINLLLTVLFFSTQLLAQAPPKMSYQAVIRNASYNLVANTPVKMRISILQGSTSGTAVYSEIHSVTTNANGLVSIEIGGGTNPTGSFSNINWGNGTYYIKTETDPANGSNYSITGTSQLLSVPYAMYAAKSGNSNINAGSNVGDMLYWNGTTWVSVPVGNAGQTLQLNQNKIPGWAGDAFAVVETLPVTDITDISATFNIKLVSNGLEPNPAPYSFYLGVCWDTLPNPIIYSDYSASDSFSVPGNYTFSSSRFATWVLVPGKKYYVRAYAENDAGVVYGNEVTFTTLPPPPTVTLLTANNWVIERYEIYTVPPSVSFPEPCQLDDYLKFNTGGTYVNNIGSITCFAGEVNTTGTWQLSPDEKTLSITNEGETETYIIELLSQTNMVLFSNLQGTGSFRIYLRKQ